VGQTHLRPTTARATGSSDRDRKLWMAGEPNESDHHLGVLFPWVTFLSRTERRDCARELFDTARACTATEDYLPLLACAKAWQSTAEAYAAGWDKEPIDWFDEPISVPRPDLMA